MHGEEVRQLLPQGLDSNRSMKTRTFALLIAPLVSGLWLAGCSKTPGEIYVSEQMKSAKAGNQWAVYNLWDAYDNGKHGVDRNPAKADESLRQFVKDVHVVRFGPASGFNPRSAGDYLKDIAQRAPEVRSDKDRLGLAGFFRTKKAGKQLMASFLSNEPDKLQAYIENNPHLKFVSAEAMTPEMFIEYTRSIQESL
jgi:hypothetical protein